jgi:hypothetical protein
VAAGFFRPERRQFLFLLFEFREFRLNGSVNTYAPACSSELNVVIIVLPMLATLRPWPHMLNLEETPGGPRRN